MDDSFNLERFVVAQDPVYKQVLAELQQGVKQTHWIWFIFPQVVGLGHSEMAKYYAIQSRDEAETYLVHPVLGKRLRECTTAVLPIAKSAQQIFGSPDDLKFRSSMTLFDMVSGNPLFGAALTRFYGGQHDQATLDIIANWTS